MQLPVYDHPLPKGYAPIDDAALLTDDNPFHNGRKKGSPRPDAIDNVRTFTADQLAHEQALWDAAARSRSYWRQREIDGDAERAAQNDAALTDRQQAERTRLEAEVKRDFLSTPAASEADWERLKDQLIDDRLKQDAQDLDKRMSAMFTGVKQAAGYGD